MEIDRNVKFLGLCKQGPVGFVVIEAPLVVIVDQGADKTQLLNTASQFVRGGRWIRYRDRSPATEAGRMLLDCCKKKVVGILAFREVDNGGRNGDEPGAYHKVRMVWIVIEYVL